MKTWDCDTYYDIVVKPNEKKIKEFINKFGNDRQSDILACFNFFSVNQNISYVYMSNMDSVTKYVSDKLGLDKSNIKKILSAETTMSEADYFLNCINIGKTAYIWYGHEPETMVFCEGVISNIKRPKISMNMIAGDISNFISIINTENFSYGEKLALKLDIQNEKKSEKAIQNKIDLIKSNIFIMMTTK